MPEINGVVVETKCEPCKGSGVVPGAFVSYAICGQCNGKGANQSCMSLASLQAALLTVPSK